MIGEALVLVGAMLAALSALGVVRFDDLLPRMHALTKASTGGIVFALLGTIVSLRSISAATTLLLALALQLFTFPVGANLIAHAVHKRARDAALVDAAVPADHELDEAIAAEVEAAREADDHFGEDPGPL